MKVSGIVCSPREGGNTEILVREALAGAGDSGAKTGLVITRDKDLQPCDGCLSCEKTGECHIRDDMGQIHTELLSADGIIWGTPVYFFSATAQAKIIIDRTYCLYANSNRLAGKVSGAISTGASLGNLGVWTLFNTFFSVHHMLSTDFVYGYARNKANIRRDRHAMKAAREMGRQMVLIAERKFKYPEEYDIALYRYVKREYSIDNRVGRSRFSG